MESIDGVPVSDDVIQRWADEAERGYDVEQLRARGRKRFADGPAPVGLVTTAPEHDLPAGESV